VTPAAAFRFFGGKGGVGKTTTAAATALAAAERGRRVLLVSTDPAHSLGDALERRLSARPTRIATRRGALAAVELDADRALERWLAARRRPLRTIAARGTYLDEDDVDRLLALSLPGVDELIGLVELHRLARAAPRDDVVVDTAPTGHTLRLLAMPDTLARIAGVLADMLAKHQFLGESLAGAHRRDAADALVAEIEGEARALHELLRDPARCRFTWVLVAEPLALEEARDGVRTLVEAGIAVDQIIVNRVTPAAGHCALCAARAVAERDVIARLPDLFPGRRLSRVPALEREPRGVSALRRVRPAGRRVRGSHGGDSITGSPRLSAAARTAAPRRAAARETLHGLASHGGDSITGSPRLSAAARTPAPRRAAARETLHRLASHGGDSITGSPRLSAAARTAAPRRAAARDTTADWLEALAPAGVRVLAFAGKGGVGKTSAAAAVALALASSRPDARILVLSTDPAHSLGDALGLPLGDDERPVPGVPGLAARELDAEAAFAMRRERYRASVDEVFDALLRGSRFDVAYDRDVVRELIDLAPPGLDELFGILSLLDALLGRERKAYDVVVLDMAPTGHALRLLAMPDAALEWVHALLAILLKYRSVVGLGEFASDLLEVARDLRELTALLRDPARTRVVAVTRPAALPRLETARLVRGLRRLRIFVGAVLVNAMTPPGCQRCRSAADAERREIAALATAVRSAGGRRYAMISAPIEAPPPHGVAGLARWLRRWRWHERSEGK
jgi:TRC40/GET3/ArsA family transport-energizing ATPase